MKAPEVATALFRIIVRCLTLPNDFVDEVILTEDLVEASL
jgi:hypothetical protein